MWRRRLTEMQNCCIDKDGASAIASALEARGGYVGLDLNVRRHDHHTHLDRTDYFVQNNNIGDSGARALAALPNNRLLHLDLAVSLFTTDSLTETDATRTEQQHQRRRRSSIG